MQHVRQLPPVSFSEFFITLRKRNGWQFCSSAQELEQIKQQCFMQSLKFLKNLQVLFLLKQFLLINKHGTFLQFRTSEELTSYDSSSPATKPTILMKGCPILSMPVWIHWSRVIPFGVTVSLSFAYTPGVRWFDIMLWCFAKSGKSALKNKINASKYKYVNKTAQKTVHSRLCR